MPGSIVRGRGPLYVIRPNDDTADEHIVNGEHILVLTIDTPPTITTNNHSGRRRFDVQQWTLDCDGLPYLQTFSFRNHSLAEAYSKKACRRHRPIIYEVKVSDYRSDRILQTAKQQSKLFQPHTIAFQTERTAQSFLSRIIANAQTDFINDTTAAYDIGCFIAVNQSLSSDTESFTVFFCREAIINGRLHPRILTDTLKYPSRHHEWDYRSD